MNKLLNDGGPSTDSEASPAHEVLMAEVRYGIVYGEMNEVFNGHLHRMLSFLSILAGSLAGGALLTLLGKIDQSLVIPWTFGFGVVAALAFSAQKAFKFNERESKFRKAKAAFQALEGSGWSMTTKELQKKLAALRKDAPSEGIWLAPLAYNRACAELGHSDVHMPVSASARIAWSLAA